MNTLKPWEQSRVTYSPKGNTILTRDFSVNQTTKTPIHEAEIVHEPEEEEKVEPKKSKK